MEETVNLRLPLLAAAVCAALVSALPASAITHGSLDDGAHPYVGLLFAGDAAGNTWVCSGTLVSPTVLVTAGHCTDGAVFASVYLEDAPTADAPHVDGTAFTAPGFDPSVFWLRDVGVVVLDSPVPLAAYGALPAAHALDPLRPGARTTFTTVGYGAERWFPDQSAASRKDVADFTRMVAHPRLITIGTPSVGAVSLVLSGNASTGGTCHGDSGGPDFLGDSNVIAGVSSFVNNPTCAGQSGVFRLDQPDVLAWLDGFLGS
jgi:hypothetical protein